MPSRKNASRTSATEPHASTETADIDVLANELFAQFNDPTRREAIDEFQVCMARAAGTVTPPQAAVHATLQALPTRQRDALLMHHDGLTCERIAGRQGRTQQAVLKDLTDAYVRLRFSIDWGDRIETRTAADGTSVQDSRRSS